MKLITLSLLLAALSLPATATAPLRTDEPGAKEQPKKTAKPKKKTGHKARFGSRKETDYSRAVRRNELLRESAEEPAKQ